MGLMIGIELVKDNRKPNPDAYTAVAGGALERGLFVLPCGPDGNIIRFLPPLNVAMADLDRGIDIIDEALTGFESAGAS
jgi:4-aminobutyrate aminotransferase-like enzyme